MSFDNESDKFSGSIGGGAGKGLIIGAVAVGAISALSKSRSGRAILLIIGIPLFVLPILLKFTPLGSLFDTMYDARKEKQAQEQQIANEKARVERESAGKEYLAKKDIQPITRQTKKAIITTNLGISSNGLIAHSIVKGKEVEVLEFFDDGTVTVKYFSDGRIFTDRIDAYLLTPAKGDPTYNRTNTMPEQPSSEKPKSSSQLR